MFAPAVRPVISPLSKLRRESCANKVIAILPLPLATAYWFAPSRIWLRQSEVRLVIQLLLVTQIGFLGRLGRIKPGFSCTGVSSPLLNRLRLSFSWITMSPCPWSAVAAVNAPISVRIGAATVPIWFLTLTIRWLLLPKISEALVLISEPSAAVRRIQPLPWASSLLALDTLRSADNLISVRSR